MLSLVMGAILATTTYALAFGGGVPSTPAPTAKKCQAGYYLGKNTGRCIRKRCKRGWAYSKRSKKCVRKTSGLLTDDDLYYEAAWLSKKAQRYHDALELLHLVKDKNQPRVLNYIGYNNRKLGKVDKGIGYYLKALALDPNYTLAMEYLGEGYLQKDEVGKARALLAKIRKICGANCAEYKDLAKEIGKYESVNRS